MHTIVDRQELTKRDLITVPPLSIDDWTMTMMSPERQKTSR